MANKFNVYVDGKAVEVRDTYLIYTYAMFRLTVHTLFSKLAQKQASKYPVFATTSVSPSLVTVACALSRWKVLPSP